MTRMKRFWWMHKLKERLQKILARSGLGSRREIEEWITAGRITVNGHLAELGEKISLKDTVIVDGRTIKLSEPVVEPRVLVYHKPVGEICTRKDPEGRPTPFEHLPKISGGKWINVGRLDVNTAGLLLFTNDGDLAHRLMHPSNQIEREYAVRIFGRVDEDILKNMIKGVELEDGLARFEHIVYSGGEGSNHWYHVVVMEGRNRLVRRLWESQGLQVSRLTRVRFGPVFLERSLPARRYSELRGKVLEKLLAD